MPEHTITTRVPTEEESKLLERNARFQSGTLIFAIILGIGAAWAFGNMGHWLGSWIDDRAAAMMQYLGWGLGGCMLVSGLIYCINGERERLRLARQDASAKRIQDIHVRNARVIEIVPHNDHAPLLCFDIGDGMLLYLRGQWIVRPDPYGVDPPEEEYDDIFNGLPDPNSFPSTEFTVARLPHTGDVLSIRIRGNYLPPQKSDFVLNEAHQLRDSEILPGSLADLTSAFERQHRRKSGLPLGVVGTYRRVHNGLSFLAQVTVELDPKAVEPTIRLDCHGEGWVAQGYEEIVPRVGYDDWKRGAIAGVYFALKCAGQSHLGVTITSISGMTTDTNPTVLAAAAADAVWKALAFTPPADIANRLEALVASSWDRPHDEVPEL